jgi:hypothetical protein
MKRPPWRVALASTIGTSHIGSGTPCQDSALHRELKTDNGPVMVVVVSDGAGSAAYSDVGSRLATETLLELIAHYFENDGRLEAIDRQQAIAWVGQTAEALVACAKENGHSIRDYACTLLGAIVGEKSAAFLQIGDGAIVVKPHSEEGWSYIFWPQHGEFANTTNFIISPNALDILEFEYDPWELDELAMFSDGIEILVLHEASKSVHDPFFDAIFPPVRASVAIGLDSKLSEGLEKYLGSPKICERTDDDKTLVLATRRPWEPTETQLNIETKPA